MAGEGLSDGELDDLLAAMVDDCDQIAMRSDPGVFAARVIAAKGDPRLLFPGRRMVLPFCGCRLGMGSPAFGGVWRGRSPLRCLPDFT